MSTMRLIVDRDGSVWSAYDESLVERWGYPEPDFDLPSFAVRNLGAVDIAVDEQRTTLTFRWLTVKPEALAGAIQMLEQIPPREVVLRCETNGWTDQGFLTPEEAIKWIVANRTLWMGGSSRSVVTTPRRLEALSERSLSRLQDHDDQLALLFKKWRLAQGGFSEDVVTFLVRFGMIDRAMIARRNGEGNLVFEHVGAGMTLYDRADPDWTYMISGRPVSAQPDADYGRWTEQIYADVLTRREPTFEHVDAVVRDGQSAARFRYDRLLLPWQLSDSADLITGLSFKTDPDAVLQA